MSAGSGCDSWRTSNLASSSRRSPASSKRRATPSRADLRARDCDVTIQSDFKQGPDSVTLLKSLYDYIRDCHAVVCLIGKRTGAYPPQAAAERFKDMLPPGMAEASYTQWEYFFARHFKRRVYIYVANDDWTARQGRRS